MGPPRPTRPKKPGRDGSGRRPRPPEAAHKRAHIEKGRRILPTVPRETVAVLFCWFRRLAVVGRGGKGAALVGAGRDSCPCNPKRLPPRARARKQRAGAGWPVRTARPTAWPAVHRRFPGRNNGDDGRQPGGALDRGPPHWAGRAGLRAPRAPQFDTTAVCTKTRSDGEFVQERQGCGASRVPAPQDVRSS